MACNSLLDHFKYMPIVIRSVIHLTGDLLEATMYSLDIISFPSMLKSNQLYLGPAWKQNIVQWLSPLLKSLG
jgi:hypothetical protein